MKWDPTLTADERCQVLQAATKTFPDVRNFVETGTADGATCRTLRDDFDDLWTVEIVPSVYQRSKQKLAVYGNIHCFLGDSTAVLPQILEKFQGPAFFWLDGHYCGSEEARGPKDTPVAEELEFIFSTGLPHVIFIDDARLFGVDPAYPTVEWVRDIATNQNIRFDFAYVDDIMRITPD